MTESPEEAADDLPVLWHLKVSHYNEKARWALELEEFFDEELGPYTRMLAMHHLQPGTDLMLQTFPPRPRTRTAARGEGDLAAGAAPAQRDHPRLEPVRAALAESGLLEWAHGIYARHRGTSAEVAAV